MYKALTVHIAAFLLAMMPTRALAFEYEVDMPNSGDPKLEMVRIMIDDCTTKFFIPKDKFEDFSKNKEALKDMVKQSLKRANNGCKN